MVSEFDVGTVEVGEEGGWEIKVFFEIAPVGQPFPVKVKDENGNRVVFDFVGPAEAEDLGEGGS